MFNFLVAYPYIKKPVIAEIRAIKKESPTGFRFLVDSGAFTAWKAGKEIKIDDYCRFIESLGDLPWRYFMLDKIGDPEGTIKNYEIMLKRGFNPIPVFTRGESLSTLDEYFKTSDVVGLGGLVGTKGNKGFVKGVMKHVGDRQVHWLGFASNNFVSYYKPYSYDCSSWASGLIYATLKLYLGGGKWKSFPKKEFAKRPSPEIINILKNKYEFDPRRLATSSQWKNSGSGEYAIEEVSFKSWTLYMMEVERHLGSKFFMAVASNWQIRLAYQAYKFWRDKNVYV